MPAPSGPRSGKHGMIDGFWMIRNWNLNVINTQGEFRHSASKNAYERVPGIDDWNFTCEGFGGYTGFFPGNYYAIALYAGPWDGICGNTGMTWIGGAWCQNLSFTWSWQPTPQINWTATFAGHSCIAPSEEVHEDESTTCLERICDIKVEYEDACDPGYVELDNVQGITLNFNCDLLEYVNSSTSCCVEREPTHWDWSLDLVEQEDYEMLVRNYPYAFKVYVNQTEYWLLKYGLLKDITNIRVDVESGAIKSKTNNIRMTSRVCCNTGSGSGATVCGSGDAVVGTIVDPCLVEWWPPACGA